MNLSKASQIKIDFAKKILKEEGIVKLAVTVLRKIYLAIPVVPDLFTWLGRQASFGFGAEKFLLLSPVNMNQSSADRRQAIRRIASQSFSEKVNVLEIGTWFGIGSTKVWMDHLPAHSSLTLLDSWTPYVSKEDSGSGGKALKSMDKLHHAAIVSTLKQVYQAEKDTQHGLRVSLIRGQSAHILKQFKSGSFDLIYIDGSHYYKDAKSDIVLAKALLNPDFSIMCGDDFELFSDPGLLKHAHENINSDFVIYSDGRGYHPGVLLAVSEEFTSVNMENGFWWVYLRNGKFSLT